MEALPVSPLTRDTLEERVYAQIRDALMEGRFAAGQPITLRAGAVVPIVIEKSLHGHFVPKDPKHPTASSWPPCGSATARRPNAPSCATSRGRPT
jgi:hypothetical protein